MILYKLIGTDGRQYGPAGADQVRQWIRENRVDRQTPVFVPGSTEWTYAGLLPEFAGEFGGPGSGGPAASAPPPIQSCPPAIIAPAYPVRCHSMAQAGLICGILAVTICCCCGGLPFSFLGLIFSLIAVAQITQNPQRHGGMGMAIIGLLLSICALLIFLLALVSR